MSRGRRVPMARVRGHVDLVDRIKRLGEVTDLMAYRRLRILLECALANRKRAELAALLDIDVTQAGTCASHLKEEGLLETVRPNGRNRDAFYVTTALGIEYLRRHGMVDE